MLQLYQEELNFRKQFPSSSARVSRVLQGLSTYDFSGNEQYTEMFALDSKSLRAYKRGKMQVSGEDCEFKKQFL